MAKLVGCSVVVVVGVVVVGVVDDVVDDEVPGTVVVVVDVVVVAGGPEDVSRINFEPLGTEPGFFVMPDSQPATSPVATVELAMLDVVGQIAVTCRAANAVVAAGQLMPKMLVGTVSNTGGGPLERVTERTDPPDTLVPAAGVWLTMSPALMVADATCLMTFSFNPSFFTNVEASAKVRPYTLGALCFVVR